MFMLSPGDITYFAHYFETSCILISKDYLKRVTCLVRRHFGYFRDFNFTTRRHRIKIETSLHFSYALVFIMYQVNGTFLLREIYRSLW